MKLKIFVLCTLFCITATVNANAQTTTTATEDPEYVYPQWVKDLRRADVVAFGVFPFAWLIASTAMDLYRSSQHGWDRNYYPWPAKPAGAPAMTNEEYVRTLIIAGSISVGLALVDALIVHIKRRRIARNNESLPRGDPIIIKRQMPDGQVIEDTVITNPTPDRTVTDDNEAQKVNSGDAPADPADPASPAQ
ncbi:MAG: hypothetical protein Ta2F_10130 [Termitinemataceae bacterium]|nr:MAG: hypothetical protein Ta2F_10130 [Termitinemataceae bacterium]